ncbi:unnamed protein product [Linum tenue]|uniref:ATP-dependent DNA helicase n=1 Tax=Linum tenue TaxID=586396 RepID=A0AAV0L6K4_9ROSI|nr:unnamed protein product [Linum tenue]
MLDETNVLVKTFRRIRQELHQSSTPNLRLRIFGMESRNRQYDLPTSDDVAGLKRISSVNPKFEALHFPLLFPYGEDGYHPLIPYNSRYCSVSAKRRFVTQREYYAFRLQYRMNEGHTLIKSGKALQHYCVDAFSTIELNRLAFLRSNQKELRAEVYQADKLGHVIIPSSYTGGPRYMQQLYYDAMATCQFFGNPDLFVTFTYKPMVVCRVFHIKLMKLIDAIKQGNYFGKTIASEIPDPHLDPIGYETVVRLMLHGPCGSANPAAPCMKDGKCSKFFPKEFSSETVFDKFGNAIYRRRDSGIQVKKGNAVLDNRHVVPYNRNLLVMMQAHINVEICHKGGLIKYLFKYLTKGPDRQSSVRSVLRNPRSGKTHLTQWFALNRRDPKARKLTYAQIPNSYTWNENDNEWTPRKKGFAIGRIAYVPPGSGDVFFLRLMLTKIHGPTRYVALRTVKGEVCPSYEKACEKLGLLSDSSEWVRVFQEISASSMPNLIRSTFVCMLMFCEVPNPIELFESSWKFMAEDHAYSLRKQFHSTAFQPSEERLRNWVLRQLQALLGSHSSSLAQFNLPQPTDLGVDDGSNSLLRDHLSFDVLQQQTLSDTLLQSLNMDQFEAYSAIMVSIHGNLGRSFFLYGHGGTGKTFLYNTVIAKLKSLSKVVIVVASSGIAATLLPNATTAHSRFKIPLHLDGTSTCSIKKGTHLAELIQEASLIVWDEALMTHRQAFEAMNRTFCDLMNIPLIGPGHKLFGGKTVLLGGDFRQTLPVIPESGREQTVDGSLTRSDIWSSFTLLRLSRNMRIDNSAANEAIIGNKYTFGEWVLALGDGKLPTKRFKEDTPSDWIEIPYLFLVQLSVDPISSIAAEIYGSFTESYRDTKYLTCRAFVTPTNAIVTRDWFVLIIAQILCRVIQKHRSHLMKHTQLNF